MTENTETTPQTSSPRRSVRPSIVIAAFVVSVPIAVVVNFLLPKSESRLRGGSVEAGTRVDRSFNGDGPVNVTQDGIAIKGYDVAAYFEDGRAVEGSSEFEAKYEGVTFRFASESNCQLFVEDPESYVPAYGGYCALGVANGYKDDLHPQAFEIFDGKLYFNLTPRIGEHWSELKEELIKQADENWPHLRDAPGYGPVDAR